MQSSWRQVYPWIEAAVVNLESPEFLLQQATVRLAKTYQAHCLLWAGLESGRTAAARVYTTKQTALMLQQTSHFAIHRLSRQIFRASAQPQVIVLQPRQLPAWLQRQRHQPKITQLNTRDLIIPCMSGGHEALPRVSTLQFVLQLQRSQVTPQADLDSTADAVNATNATNVTNGTNATDAINATNATDATGRLESRATESIVPASFRFHLDAEEQPGVSQSLGKAVWQPEEMASLEVLASELILAYSALYWRERLEQSRQQSALMGRITQLLNSNFNPDEVIQRLVAEVGQGLNRDRVVLLDMHRDMVHPVAVWQHPARSLPRFSVHSTPQTLWQEVIEMFTQGGASHIELDLTDNLSDSLQEWLQSQQVVSALMVPLFIRSDFFGSLMLLSYQAEPSYPLDQLQTLRHVADQAAISLINAQRYQSGWMQRETRRIQNNDLQLESIRDELTKLLNRNALNHELDELSAPTIWALQPSFAIILGDIDYFQLVNDTHGHHVGNEVLQGIAVRLQSQLRHGTSVYRYGGEEFVIILTNTTAVGGADVAERLRKTVRSHSVETQAGLVKVTMSFGVAQQSISQDMDAHSVLQRAEQAMDEAKRQGRDRVVVL